MLKDFEERPGEEHSAQGAGRPAVRRRSAQITGAMVIPFLPPSIQGLGQFGGFTYELLDQSGGPIENLEAAAQQLIGAGQPDAGPGRRCSRSSPPTIRSWSSTIDREQAKSLGMSLGDVTSTMQILLGSAYVNDFDFNNRSYRVYVQADQPVPLEPGDIERYSGADRATAG